MLVRTMVRSAAGHAETGPSGVAAQSSARQRSRISPAPANTDPTASRSASLTVLLSSQSSADDPRPTALGPRPSAAGPRREPVGLVRPRLDQGFREQAEGRGPRTEDRGLLEF